MFDGVILSAGVKYKGIIFDFNGVLLWDTVWQDQAWREVSQELRGHPLTQAEMKSIVYGRTNREIFSYVLGRTLTETELVKLIEHKEDIYRRTALAQGKNFTLSPGAQKLLDYLAEYGIPRTIATASEITNVKFFIEHLHLDTWFRVEDILYDDGKLPSKPDPTIYLLAAKKIGLTPQECIVVEDALSGIEAARRAGVGKIIALGLPSEREVLLSVPGVSQVVTNLGEVDSAEFALPQ